VLNLITIVSFVLSAVNVMWVTGLGLLILIAGSLAWIGGPATGAIGTAIGLALILLLMVQFALSLLLFSAAWATMKGEPKGRSRHKTWAWIIVLLDLIDLIFTGGMDPGAWVRLIYAVFLIVMLDRIEVRAYFDQLRY
jgi:hypothetical protein